MRKSEEEEMTRRKEDFDDEEEFLSELNGVSITEYSFNPTAWSRAYGDLNAKLYATAKETELNYVAEMDVANFYDSIRLDILEIRMREIANEKDVEVIGLLFYFLNYWNKKDNLFNKQTVGIPQDAIGDFSRILANFYLQDYDEFMSRLCKENGGKYLRYADDQFLFANSEEDLLLLVHKASIQLSKYGLSINQKKVSVRTTEELMVYRAFETFSLLAEREDRKDKDKVELFVREALEVIKDHGQDIQSGGKHLVNRALFCPAVFGIDKECKRELLRYLLTDSYLEHASSDHLDRIHQLLGNDRDRARFVRKLRKKANEAIHNVFHYSVLGFETKRKLDTSHIRDRIEELRML